MLPLSGKGIELRKLDRQLMRLESFAHTVVYFGELGYEIAAHMNTCIGINSIGLHLLELMVFNNAKSLKGEDQHFKEGIHAIIENDRGLLRCDVNSAVSDLRCKLERRSKVLSSVLNLPTTSFAGRGKNT